MLLTTKKLSFLGVLLAVTVVFIILSGVFEFNTIFLLAAASFGVGIAIREGGFGIGIGFYLGAVILSLFLAPNKLYILTFGAMGLYLLMEELVFMKFSNMTWKASRGRLFWMLKYIVFNVMYLPMLLFIPRLVYQGEINTGIKLVLIIGGQVALFLYDMAYHYFQSQIWSKYRKKLLE